MYQSLYINVFLCAYVLISYSFCVCVCLYVYELVGVCVSVCSEEEAVLCTPQEKRGNPIHLRSLGSWWGTQHHPCLVVCMHMSVSEQFVFIFMFNRPILKYVYKHCRFYVIDINSIHFEFF